MTSQEQSKKLLDPILDVIGGADGGVAFARLQHNFLPEMIERYEALDPEAREFMLMVTRFSKMCELMLERK